MTNQSTTTKEALELGCTCQCCGNRYKVDTQVADDVWERIKPAGKISGAGLLCGPCIFSRIEALGEFDALSLSRVYAPSVALVSNNKFIEAFKYMAIRIHFGYKHDGPWEKCEWIQCEDRRKLIAQIAAPSVAPEVDDDRQLAERLRLLLSHALITGHSHGPSGDYQVQLKFRSLKESQRCQTLIHALVYPESRESFVRQGVLEPFAPASTVAPQQSLLRDPVRVNVTPPVMVTRNGVPCEDQQAALEEFKEACRSAAATSTKEEQQLTPEQAAMIESDSDMARDRAVAPVEQSDANADKIWEACKEIVHRINMGEHNHPDLAPEAALTWWLATIVAKHFESAPASPAPPTLHCSCGAACTEDEYAAHRAMGHDAAVGVGDEAQQCPATCADFSMYLCGESHRCVLDAGHPFDPYHGGGIHEFETHPTIVKPREVVATTSPSTPAKAAAEEIQDWNECGESQGSHDADVAFIQAIIERCLAGGG